MVVLSVVLCSALIVGSHSAEQPNPFPSFSIEMNAELHGPVNDSTLVATSKNAENGVRKYWKFDAYGKEVGSIVRSSSERPIGVDDKRELVFYTPEVFTSPGIASSPASIICVAGRLSVWTWDDKELAVRGPDYIWRLPVDYFVGAVDIDRSGKTMVVGEDVGYDVDSTDRSVLHVLSLTDKQERVVRLKLGTTSMERVTDDLRFINETQVAMLVRPTKEGSLNATAIPHISADEGDAQGWIVERAWLAVVELGTGTVTLIASIDVLEYRDIGGYPSNLLVAFQSPRNLLAVRCGARVWLVPVPAV